jgi:hypothetical protein
MNRGRTVRSALKRGGLIVAANWPVVVIQFIAESVFKLLLAAPVVGGALLVALLLGGDLFQLLGGGVRDGVTGIADALIAEPVALASFIAAFGLVLAGGSALMFTVKGGTVGVLVEGERRAGPVERPPLRLAALRAASQFGIDRFVSACTRLVRRFLRLGFLLLLAYALSAIVYLSVVVGGYRWLDDGPFAIVWTAVATLWSTALILWITLVNLIYLLLQMIVAVEDIGVRAAARRTVEFLAARGREVAAVFLTVLLFVVAATAGSILATAGLGLIAFVPLAGLAVFPLQVIAWLVRSLVFQYLGLSALVAYLTIYRSFREGLAAPPALPAEPGIRTA